MNHFSSPLSPRLALCSYTQGQASVESCAQASSQPSFYIRRETLPEASQPCGPGQPWGMVSEIKGPIFPKDLFPQVPVPQMQFAGEGYMFLSELIGLAVLISSLETCIQQLYTCLLSHKMQLTGVIVIRCVKVGRQSCAWKARPVCSRKSEKCDFYGLNLVVLGESCQEARIMQEGSVHYGKGPELGQLGTSWQGDLRTFTSSI